MIVGSKWGYTYTADWQVDADVHEVKDLSLATLCRQLQESRALLGAHLRLYQIHSATLESGVLEDPAVLEELQRLRGGGLRIGFTVTGPRQAETIERGLTVGLFDAVQATWNLFERSAGDPLARAHEAGLAVIVKEALANGRLTAAGDAALLTDLAADAEVTPDALALAAALAQPWADIVLSGASTPEQLNSNVAATRVQLSQDMLERLDALREDPASYWETRAALPWNSAAAHLRGPQQALLPRPLHGAPQGLARMGIGQPQLALGARAVITVAVQQRADHLPAHGGVTAREPERPLDDRRRDCRQRAGQQPRLAPHVGYISRQRERLADRQGDAAEQVALAGRSALGGQQVALDAVGDIDQADIGGDEHL